MLGEQKQVFFPSGTALFREGDKAQGAYLIVTGEVSAFMEAPSRGRVTLETIEPPAYLALADSLAGDCHSYTTRAIRDTRALFIPREHLMETFSNPESAGTLLQALAQEVSITYQELRNARDKFGGHSVTRKRPK